MDLALVIAALGVIGTFAGVYITWYAARKTSAFQDEELTIEGHPWVRERFKGDYEKFLGELIGLDHAAVSGLTDETAGDAKTKSLVFEKSLDTWALVVSRNRQIVAYWSFFSLSDRLIKRLKNGTMFDSEIVAREVYSISEPRRHNLYFEMFCIHPAFEDRRLTILKMLLVALNEIAQLMRTNKVQIAGIYANGFTKEGAALCRDLGLRRIASSAQEGDVFYIDDSSLAEQKLDRAANRRRFSIF